MAKAGQQTLHGDGSPTNTSHGKQPGNETNTRGHAKPQRRYVRGQDLSWQKKGLLRSILYSEN